MEFVRANAVALGAGVVLLAAAAGAVRFVANNRAGPPPPRKVMQFTMVNLRPPPPPPEPLKPPPEPKEEEPDQTTRVNLKPTDFTQPDNSRPAPAAGGGRLALAAEGSGSGDAFNLSGNPGGKGLLSGGGLGDGSGDEVGEGDGQGNRDGWDYARIAGELDTAFRKLKVLTAAPVRVEIKLWAEAAGRISRIQLIRSTGDPRVDEAIQTVVGTRLSEPPPAGIAMPMIARLTARRPQ